MPATTTLKHQKLQLLADPLSSIQNISHCLPQPDGDESLIGATASSRPTSQLSPTTKTTSSSSSSTCHSSKNDKNPFIIYTDGACQGNGKEGARAGVGVYYGKNDPRNISTFLEGERQTNQRAELTAIKLALDGIVNNSGACDSYIIKSDSNYCVRGLNTHLKNGRIKDGWTVKMNQWQIETYGDRSIN